MKPRLTEGTAPRRNLRGSLPVVYYSNDPASRLPLPSRGAIRWSRIGTRPH